MLAVERGASLVFRAHNPLKRCKVQLAKRIVLIDASRDVDQVENEIWGMLASRFPALTTNPKS